MRYDEIRNGIRRPRLDWSRGAPFSADFGDTYFDGVDGLAESRAVYLRLNGLPERWSGRRSFVIGELGFGAGLNFLATLSEWRRHRDPGGWLHYVAFESCPMTIEEIARATARWSELAPEREALASRYPDIFPGLHRVDMPERGVTLTLVFGDAREWLPVTQAEVDAWFLDGFAPAVNPELWDPDLLSLVSDRSTPGATFATYTVSRPARSALEAVGFEVAKVPGHGRKRENLTGSLLARARRASSRPWLTQTVAPRQGGTALVAGAGLAGCSAAMSLAKRGWRVTVLDRAAAHATGASGNSAAAVVPYVSLEPSVMSRLYLPAFGMLVRHLRELGTDLWRETGALQLSSTPRMQRLVERLPELGLPSGLARKVSAAEAIELSGVRLPHEAVHYPSAGWTVPRDLCTRSLELFPGVRLGVDSTVKELTRTDGQWIALTDSGKVVCEADVAIVASGVESLRFEQTSWLPLEPVKGQLTAISESRATSALRSVICYDGYVLPALDGCHLLGATFEHAAQHSRACPEKSAGLFNRLLRWWPDASAGEIVAARDRASFRASTHDRLPYIGAVPDHVRYLDEFAELKKGFPASRFRDAPLLPDLYVTAGHGSRGLLSTFLGGELIASMICGEPLPLDTELIEAVNPARYLARSLMGMRYREIPRLPGL